ncbi:MAG TPA: transcription antitermination factor NusB [Candidatus Cloacimonetes bacterium]|nr:transcription antitermination factor NusB [Candidatus Cloacimonadota bacterium]HEX37853.1 transcription antitermination factor NusB [Candidatus Cloacimonadota bacterium]
MNRREAREIAVQMLYGLYFEDIPKDDNSFVSLLERKFNEIISESDVTFTLVDKDFCINLVAQTHQHLSEIDEYIKQFSKKWSFERITVIEKSILRLAIMEIEFSDIPNKVAINEAIELAEDFSGHKSKKFVNGILDAVMHRKEKHD